MGLFIGASVLTILEIFDYLYEVKQSYLLFMSILIRYIIVTHLFFPQIYIYN